MMKKFENKKIFFIYCGIIVLQLFTYIYWANMRSNFYVDELYSKGYASRFLGTEDTANYITVSEEFKYDEWIDNSLLQKQVIVSEKESILNISALENIKSLILGRNYIWLLNLAESILGDGNISAIPGMVLNIVFLVIAEIVLICLFRRLNVSNRMTIMGLAMFGFSGFIIGIVEYIRFYALVTMLALVVVWLHYIIWTTDRVWKVIVCEIVSAVLAYLMLKNSEMTIPFMGGLIACFILGALFTKKWRMLISYMAMPLLALVYMLITPKFSSILFNLAEAPLISNIFRTTINSIGLFGSFLANHLIQYYFGHMAIVVLWCLVIAAIIMYKKERKLDISIDLNRVLVSVCGVIIVCALVSQGIVHSMNDKLMIGLCLVAILGAILYICFPWIKKVIPVLREKKNTPETQYIFILAGTFLIYSIFVMLTRMSNSSRYCFPAMMIFMIVFWYAIDQLIKKMGYADSKFVNNVLVILVVLSCISPFFTRQIEYIYADENALVTSLEEYQGVDAVLVGEVDEDGESSRHEVYDCVNLMSADANIYPIDNNSFTYSSGMFPDDFIMWSHYLRDIEGITSELRKDGYKVERLGETHVSSVYYCTR